MTKIAVLGGSSVSSPQLAAALSDWAGPAGQHLEVMLIGRSAQKLELVAKACRQIIGPPGAVSVRTATNVEQGLAGASIVINQVRVGGLPGRAFDERFPWQLGIPGEETVGPGGFSLACRTIPVVRDLFRACEHHAGGATVLNLTNPAGIVHQVAARTTSLRVITLCDSPATLIERAARQAGTDPRAVRPSYLGTNHAGWLTGLWQDGHNVLPAALAHAEVISPGIDPRIAAWLQAAPNPYLRYFYHPDRQLASQQAQGATRAEELAVWEANALAAYAGGGVPEQATKGRKAPWYRLCVVPAVAAILTQRPLTMVVNITNGGLLPSLPGEATIEITAQIEKGGVVTPLPLDPLPPDAAALLGVNAAYECLTVDAILAGDYGAKVRALAANPLVPSVGVAERAIELIGTGQAWQ